MGVTSSLYLHARVYASFVYVYMDENVYADGK